MRSADYNRIREMIESTFRLDMAALERVWFRVNGCNPPDSLVSLAEKDETPDDPAPRGESTGLRSAEAMGIQSAGRMEAMHRGGTEKRKKKVAGGRALGWARFRAKKAGKDPETMTEEELQAFVK